MTFKDQGNALFKQGDYLKAAALYTKALKTESPDSAVLYSNRSAALLKLNKVAKALADAEECIRLDPSWDKGYLRKALALESQQRLDEAVGCYQEALKASNDNPEYATKVKALSKHISRRTQVATKIAKEKARKCPYEQAALAFAESKLAYAVELIQEHGSSFPPELHFLQGGGSSKGSKFDTEQEGTAVRAAHAFDAPELLAQFLQEMRAKSEQLAAQAVVLIAPKTAIAFPQVWRKATWPFGDHDGVFVQLQASVEQAPSDSSSTDQQRHISKPDNGSSKLLRRVWFIRLRVSKPPLESQEVSQEFELLPPLLK